MRWLHIGRSAIRTVDLKSQKGVIINSFQLDAMCIKIQLLEINNSTMCQASFIHNAQTIVNISQRERE